MGSDSFFINWFALIVFALSAPRGGFNLGNLLMSGLRVLSPLSFGLSLLVSLLPPASLPPSFRFLACLPACLPACRPSGLFLSALSELLRDSLGP